MHLEPLDVDLDYIGADIVSATEFVDRDGMDADGRSTGNASTVSRAQAVLTIPSMCIEGCGAGHVADRLLTDHNVIGDSVERGILVEQSSRNRSRFERYDSARRSGPARSEHGHEADVGPDVEYHAPRPNRISHGADDRRL